MNAVETLKSITIEELRKCLVIVYTQEEVDLLESMGVAAIITYVNGGICYGPTPQIKDKKSPGNFARRFVKEMRMYRRFINLIKKWKNRRLKKEIINRLLANPNHRPCVESTVLIAYDLFMYITCDSDEDSSQL